MRATAYPVREAAGIVWAYLGPPGKLPHFPEYLWLRLYPERSAAFKVLEECNYAQALEGGLDFAHAPILHRYSPWAVRSLDVREQNLAPEHAVQDTPYGLRYGAVWPIENGQHIRISPYVMPWWTVVAPSGFGGRPAGSDRIVNAFVPRDDVSTWHFQYYFDPEKPIDVEWRKRTAGFQIDADFRKTRNRDNNWLQDREEMRLHSMSGIDGIVTQDHAVNESQGPIVDRSREHLGASDVAVIGMRRRMLAAARELQQGIEPPGLDPAFPFERILSETFDAPYGLRLVRRGASRLSDAHQAHRPGPAPRAGRERGLRHGGQSCRGARRDRGRAHRGAGAGRRERAVWSPAAGTAASAPTAERALQSVTIGSVSPLTEAPALIAEQRGYFAAVGLKVEITGSRAGRTRSRRLPPASSTWAARSRLR